MSNAAPLIDGFGRRIEYLRLSVTDRCDLRCAYCMPERMEFLPRAEVLTLEELHVLALAFVERGVRKIRLTGGEPLVRRDMIELVRALGRQVGNGLEELTLTTNGTQLARLADDLASAGVRRINVSLDTLDRETYARIAKRDMLQQVLEGLDAARAAGLKIKINTVALADTNADEIPAIIAWAHDQSYDVTLIEVMPLGETGEDRVNQHLPLDVVRRDLEARWTLRESAHRTGGPSRYVEVAETGGRLGFITPLTQNFCAGCNRVRVTATGQLYGCLGGEQNLDLRAALRGPEPEAAVDAALDAAMLAKPERHHFAIPAAGEATTLSRHMSRTGG